MSIGISIMHPEKYHPFSARTYQIQSRPHPWYALDSVMRSGAVRAHFVLSADTDIVRAASELGCVPVPMDNEAEQRIESDKTLLYDHISSYIIRELALDLDPGPGSFVRLTQSERLFFLDCNNCLIRPATIRAMRDASIQGRPMVFLTTERKHETFMLAREDGSLFPLLFDTTQEFYFEEHLPRICGVSYYTRFQNSRDIVPGRPKYFHHIVDEMEGLYLTNKHQARMAESFLERNPDHFA